MNFILDNEFVTELVFLSDLVTFFSTVGHLIMQKYCLSPMSCIFVLLLKYSVISKQFLMDIFILAMVYSLWQGKARDVDIFPFGVWCNDYDMDL